MTHAVSAQLLQQCGCLPSVVGWQIGVAQWVACVLGDDNMLTRAQKLGDQPWDEVACRQSPQHTCLTSRHMTVGHRFEKQPRVRVATRRQATRASPKGVQRLHTSACCFQEDVHCARPPMVCKQPLLRRHIELRHAGSITSDGGELVVVQPSAAGLFIRFMQACARIARLVSICCIMTNAVNVGRERVSARSIIARSLARAIHVAEDGGRVVRVPDSEAGRWPRPHSLVPLGPPIPRYP